MFYGINFYLVTVSLIVDDIAGQMLSLFILTIAAAESAIALALIMSYFKIYKDILLDN
jgi:NADH-quinone oxidoreductase subunit K